MRQLAVPKNGTEDFDRLEKLAEVSGVRLPPLMQLARTSSR